MSPATAVVPPVSTARRCSIVASITNVSSMGMEIVSLVLKSQHKAVLQSRMAVRCQNKRS